MRLALFTETFYPKLDGIARTLATSAQRLEAGGQRVLVFAPQPGPAWHGSSRVVRLPGPPLPVYPGLRWPRPSPELVSALRAFQPDLVHVADPALLGLIGLALARTLHIPVVSSYHTHLAVYAGHFGLPGSRGLVWRLLRAVHGAARLTLCPSPATLRTLRRRGFRRLRLWDRGVDPELFRPERRSLALRRAWTGDAEAPLLLYVGRLSPEKRLERLLPVLDQAPQARLLVVGDGPARARWQALFPAERTTFTGFLRGERLAAAYASADLFAFPSESETFGLVVLEAMASGLPVVAFDRGALAAQVTHGHDGLLCPPDDLASFARATRLLLSDPAWRQQLGRQARLSALARSWDQPTAQLLAAYHEALGQPVLQPAAPTGPHPPAPAPGAPGAGESPIPSPSALGEG